MKLDYIHWAEECLTKRKGLVKVLEFEEADCDLRITVLSRDGDVTFTTDHNCTRDRDLQRDIYKALRKRLQVLDKDIEDL